MYEYLFILNCMRTSFDYLLVINVQFNFCPQFQISELLGLIDMLSANQLQHAESFAYTLFVGVLLIGLASPISDLANSNEN